MFGKDFRRELVKSVGLIFDAIKGIEEVAIGHQEFAKAVAQEVGFLVDQVEKLHAKVDTLTEEVRNLKVNQGS